jgi:hypothetical protein
VVRGAVARPGALEVARPGTEWDVAVSKRDFEGGGVHSGSWFTPPLPGHSPRGVASLPAAPGLRSIRSRIAEGAVLPGVSNDSPGTAQ